MKKAATLTVTSLLASSLLFGTAFAFSDVEEGQSKAITSLQERGIVNGVDSEHFAPKGKITYAQGIQLLVKGLNLNMDTLRFIKQPLASDTYTDIPNDAWYAEAFIIAHYNGLEIPKDVNPNEELTREQFADLIVRALEKKGNFPLIKMFIAIKDEAAIKPEYQGAIQRLLLYKLTQLDKDGNFNPKGEMTRGEAAVWVYNAVQFLERQSQKPIPAEEVKVATEKVNDSVNKVTISRGEKPNAGYGIEITGIRFEANHKAVITYKLRDPEPDGMYADVITVPKAETYVASSYTVVTEPAS